MGKKTISVPGTVWQRESGRWAAVSGQVTIKGRVVVDRVPPGIFDTEKEAEADLLTRREHLASPERRGLETPSPPVTPPVSP
jgi:hypothetical protein